MDYIVLVGRYRNLFRDRSITFTDADGSVELVIPTLNDVVLCDVCGNPVYSPLIMLLVLDGSVWGELCGLIM